MTKTHQLFATPFIVDRLQSEQGIVMLRNAIHAEMERDKKGVAISNIGGWHSNTDMLEWGGEAAKALVFKAMQMADEQTLDAKAPSGDHFSDGRFGWIPELWANVSEKGNANQYHTHPGSFWSIVAYIDDGYEGDDDGSLGGELQLLDPRMPMVRMTAPDLRMKDASGGAAVDEVSIRPQTGMVVMFPSWLQHAVRPFLGEGTRISIAINLIPAMKKPH